MKYTNLYPLPLSVKALCSEDLDGNQIIVLNAKYTHEENLKSYRHEISHAEDLGNAIDVNEVESKRHEY